MSTRENYTEEPFDGSAQGSKELQGIANIALITAAKEIDNVTRIVEILRLIYWLQQ